MSAFDNATLMITGGTGSFGSTVLKHFLDSDLKEFYFTAPISSWISFTPYFSM